MQKMLSLTEEIFSFAVRIFCLMEKVFSFATRIFWVAESIFSFGEDLLHDGKHLFVFKHDALRLWKDVVSAPKHPRPNEGKANRHYEDARRRTNDFLREAPANGHPLPHDMPPGTELRQSQAGCFRSSPARSHQNSVWKFAARPLDPV